MRQLRANLYNNSDLINQRNRFRELAYRKNRKQVNFDLLQLECNYKYVTHAYIFKNIVNLTSRDVFIIAMLHS